MEIKVKVVLVISLQLNEILKNINNISSFNFNNSNSKDTYFKISKLELEREYLMEKKL